MAFKEQLIITDLTGGINSKQRSNKIADNEMVSIIGFDFDANTLRRAKGYTKKGTESSSDLTGKTLYTHQRSSGEDILVKTIGTFVKFYDSVDDAWYKTTLTTFTAGLRWSFSSAYGFMYGNNGTDNWIYWNANAKSTLNGAVTAGATTIDLVDASAFPASGTGMCQDDQFAWTGKSTNQLTGVTGVDSNHASGSIAILQLDGSTYSSLDQAKQVRFHKNRTYMIDTDNNTIMRFSKLADNANPETDIINFTVAGSGVGDAGFNYAPDEMVSMIEFVSGSDALLLVTCKNGTVYSFVVTDASSTTTSVFTPVRTMNSYPLNVQSLIVAENDLAFIDQYNHIRTLRYGDVSTPLQVKTISDKIRPSLEATDFDNSAMAYHNRKLYAGGATIENGTNDIYFYHDADYTAWGAYGHWDVTDFAEYNSELYGLSIVSGDVWKLQDGYSVYISDDTENNEGDYYSEAVTKAFNWGLPFTYKEQLKIRMSGFITSNTPAFLDVYLDGGLFTSFEISGNNTDILGAVPNVAVGTVVFGIGVFGGTAPGGSVRREFVAQLQFNAVKQFLKAQFRLRMEGKNIDFEMNDMAVFAKEEGKENWIKAQIITPS